jgi:hypothetical protein
MFGFVWLTLRQAQEAIRYGRLDEALRLLQQPAARSHRRAGELSFNWSGLTSSAVNVPFAVMTQKPPGRT